MLLFEPIGVICTKLAIADEAFAALLVEAVKKAEDALQLYELDRFFEWEEMTRNMRVKLACQREEKYCSENRQPDTPPCHFMDTRTRMCALS